MNGIWNEGPMSRMQWNIKVLLAWGHNYTHGRWSVTKKRGRFQTTDTLDVGQTHPEHYDPEFPASMSERHLHGAKTQSCKQSAALHTDSIIHPTLKTQLRLWSPNSDFHSKLHRDISFGPSNICVKIVQVAQHLDITDSQSLKPTDHPHLVLRTPGSTLTGSHNNLASTPKHQIMHCWLASSATEKFDQLTNSKPLLPLCLSSVCSLTLTTPFSQFLPTLSLLPSILLLVSLPLFLTLQTAIPFQTQHRPKIIIRSRHSASILIQCSHHANLQYNTSSQTNKASHAEVK